MATNPPVVSIIIPLYNAGRLILETLGSIRAQTMDDWEVIVVDDGSIDDGPALVEALAAKDPRFRLFRQTNAGPAVARHYGVLQARTRWMMFVDADDLLPPDRLSRDLAVLQANPQSSAVAGSVEWFVGDGKAVHQGLLSASPEVNRWRHQFHSVYYFAALTMLREAYLACGGFNPDRSVFYAEDYDLTLRLLESVEITEVAAISLRIRKHDTNRSTLAERTVIEHTLEVICRVWKRKGVELSLEQTRQLFLFWRQEPSTLTVADLEQVIRLQTTLGHHYLKSRPVAAGVIAKVWEQTLALRLFGAKLSPEREADLLKLEAQERGRLTVWRVRLRLFRLRR